MPVVSKDELLSRVGEVIGTSGWVAVPQEDIDTFATLTGDTYFIHTDPEQAARTPLGGTIAHGLLTLSLLPKMAYEVMLGLESRMSLNYGFDQIRFLSPVRAGKRVRGHFTLASAEERKPGEWRVVHDVSVEIEGEDKPALTARWIGLSLT